MVNGACRLWNIFINRSHQCCNFFGADVVIAPFQGCQSRPCNNWDVVARVIVGAEQFTNFHLDQFEQFFVIHLIHFVHENNHGRNTNLTAKQDVLAGLWHWAICRVYHKNRAIHLRRTGNHIFHIVGVAGAINVRIVTIISLILNVSGRNGDTTGFFFRRCVDLIIVLKITKLFGDRSSQRGFAVVNMANGTDVAMRLITFKLFLCHDGLLLILTRDKHQLVRHVLGKLRLNFFRDILRNRVIVIKLHRELRSARRHRTQCVDIAKHIGQRHE